MATEIKMPQLGESVVEGTITRWLKKEGDSVAEDELLVEVSTDKVDSEVPSSAAGTIQKILVQEGETVKVGTAIAVVGEGAAEPSGDGAGQDGEQASAEASEEPEDQQDTEEQPEEEQSADEQPAARAEPDEESEAATSSEPEGRAEPEEDEEAEPAREGDADTSKRKIISPLVRRLAQEHGIDLEDVQGSGTGGRIRKQDVLRYVEQGGARKEPKAPAASAEPAREEPAREERARRPAAAGAERDELVPWTNIRRRTAEHMAASARETARAWNAVEVDWTRTVKVRESAKEPFRQREGFNLTYMAFLGRAVCETLREMPEVNARFDEEQQGNVLRHYVNLGIAVALEGGGLIVPVVKGADELNLVGLARAINDVVTRARSKKLSPDDLSGGTFTITNPGPFGSVISVPIIPRQQTAILGFEAIQKRVVVTDDDALAIRHMGFLSLSWDHRTIDGAEAARFLARLKERVENDDPAPDVAQYLQ